MDLSKKIISDDGLWLHAGIKQGLDHLKEAVGAMWDGVIVIDGPEGSGKSTLAFTCAFHLDPDFSLKNVVFTSEQFFEAIDKAPVGSAIVYDEFVTGGLSSDAVSKVTKTLTKKMVMIRKKRLYIFLVIPYVFMLTKYFALARTRFLLHAYSPDGIKRGYVSVYKGARKNKLYNLSRKYYDYSFVKPNFSCSFANFFSYSTPFSEDDYDLKKESAIIDLTDQDDDKVGVMAKRYKNILSFSLKHLRDIDRYNTNHIIRLYKSFLSEPTIRNLLSDDFGDDYLQELKEEAFVDGDV